MKLNKIGLISNFPVFEFINAPSPLIFLKIGDRQIDLLSAKRINGKFFHTKLGVFELDGEYENTMMGQPFYIFNLQNGKPISLRHIEKIQELYRTNRTNELTDMLATISENVDKGMESSGVDKDGEPVFNYTTPLDALKSIQKATPDFLSNDDVKFIINYKHFDMPDLKIFNFKKISEMKPDSDMSRKIPTIFPMVVVSGIGISAVLLLAVVGIGKIVRMLGNDPDVRGKFIMGIDVVRQGMEMLS